MARKKENGGNDQVKDMVQKIKSTCVEAIVRQWLNTPLKEFDNKSPLQMVANGDGQKVLDAIKQAEVEIKSETKPQPIKKNGTDNTRVKEIV
jgi:hypothetical protein